MKIRELISVFLIVCMAYLFMGQLSSGAFKNTFKKLKKLTEIGDGTKTLAINTSDWDISATGVMTGIGNITSDGEIKLNAAKKLYFDGGTNDYIYASSDNVIEMAANNSMYIKAAGNTGIYMTGTQATSARTRGYALKTNGSATGTTPVFHIYNDDNTGLGSPGADTLSVITAGNGILVVSKTDSILFFKASDRSYIGSFPAR